MADPTRLFAPAKLSLEELVLATGARLVRNTAGTGAFRGLATDNRAVRTGCLFVALRGERFDGVRFATSSLDAGAAGLLVDEQSVAEVPERGVVLAVPDSLEALGEIARAWRTVHGARLIGLTGSTGKTSTKEMIASILRSAARDPKAALATEGNFNNLIGVPLTLLRLDDRHEFGVIEMGMSVPDEIARLAHVTDADVGIVINASAAHLAGLGSVEAVARAKAALYRSLRPGAIACVPSYEPRLLGEVRATPPGVHVLAFGERADDPIRLLSAEGRGFDGVSMVLSVEGQLLDVSLPLLGTHLVYNALAATAAAHALGIGLRLIARGLAAAKPIPGRLFPLRDVGGLDILDDTYNSNPASVMAGLEALTSVAGERRTVAVLGDMLELGQASTMAHESVGAAATAAGIHALVLYGPEMRAAADTAGAAGLEVFWSEEFPAARDHLVGLVEPGDVVLVKGSRGMKTERFVRALQERAS